jgi:hypothetical protein
LTSKEFEERRRRKEVAGGDPPTRWRGYGVTMVTGGERKVKEIQFLRLIFCKNS